MTTMRWSWAVLWVLAGCVEYEKGASGDDTGEPPGETTSPGGSDAAPTSSGADETADPPAQTTGGSGVDGECDLWAQDCPAGSKCMPVDSNANGDHDTSKCEPLMDPAGLPGDACHVEGSAASGVDDCALGSMCWGIDKNNNGACVEMCWGSEEDPRCSDGLQCDISNGGVLILCVAPCDPLTPSCPEGKICIPGNEESVFFCDTDASGDEGAYGDPCEYINVCDPGLFCGPGNGVPGCVSPACCTPYCELGQPNTCPGQGQECVSFYGGASEVPPGFEDVGLCMIPM